MYDVWLAVFFTSPFSSQSLFTSHFSSQSLFTSPFSSQSLFTSDFSSQSLFTSDFGSQSSALHFRFVRSQDCILHFTLKQPKWRLEPWPQHFVISSWHCGHPKHGVMDSAFTLMPRRSGNFWYWTWMSPHFYTYHLMPCSEGLFWVCLSQWPPINM